jgi:DICT domain-containing protein
MEDRVLAGTDRPLLIASFQQEKFYRQEAHRYRRLGEISDQVYVLAAPDTEFSDRATEYELVPFEHTDALASEWHLVAIGAQSSACLICREKIVPPSEIPVLPEIDASRRFEGIWTFAKSRSPPLIFCSIASKFIAPIWPLKSPRPSKNI